MKQNQEYNENYEYEHDVRNIVEKTDNTRAFYNNQTNIWDVEIDYGNYNFIGKISQEGIPTEGAIIHDDISVYCQNNNELIDNNFKDTIISLYQNGINKMYQEEANNNTFPHHTTHLEAIQEQENESDSEEKGNVIHEHPTLPTQQHQNQSNLNLKSGQSRKFGRSNSK